MKNAAAFKASFADWKLIKTRGCVQVVFEIPLHEADAAYQALGGMPDPAKERWFGIARLNPSNVAGVPATSAAREAGEDLGEPSTSASRPRKPVAIDKRLAQQAGIACADPMFQAFLATCKRNAWDAFDVMGMQNATRTERSASTVRVLCGVGSRKEIVNGTPEGDEWQKLYGEFLVWRDVPELAPAHDHQGERV